MTKSKLFFLIIAIFSACSKDSEDIYVLSFNLDGNSYNFNSGNALNAHSGFDYIILAAENTENKNNVMIQFKTENKNTYKMPVDTFYVNIDIGKDYFYRTSNWPNFGFYPNSNNNFNLTIEYQDSMKISGKFSGTMYYIKDYHNSVLEKAELQNGEFNLLRSYANKN